MARYLLTNNLVWKGRLYAAGSLVEDGPLTEALASAAGGLLRELEPSPVQSRAEAEAADPDEGDPFADAGTAEEEPPYEPPPRERERYRKPLPKIKPVAPVQDYRHAVREGVIQRRPPPQRRFGKKEGA
jgi:hypothetical protein